MVENNIKPYLTEGSDFRQERRDYNPSAPWITSVGGDLIEVHLGYNPSEISENTTPLEEVVTYNRNKIEIFVTTKPEILELKIAIEYKLKEAGWKLFNSYNNRLIAFIDKDKAPDKEFYSTLLSPVLSK